jgi:hypothetical protein
MAVMLFLKKYCYACYALVLRHTKAMRGVTLTVTQVLRLLRSRLNPNYCVTDVTGVTRATGVTGVTAEFEGNGK